LTKKLARMMKVQLGQETSGHMNAKLFFGMDVG